MADDLVNDRPWCENGLLCDNPDEKINELRSLDIWWSIIGAIDTLKTLKENNRMEL